MRVVYVAKHGIHGNADEDAVGYALEQLGCEVVRIEERDGRAAAGYGCDLLLFHKWADVESIRRCDARVKAFWYFDLVEWPEPTVARRCEVRKRWMRSVMPFVDVGFCTDGDWAAKHPEKLVHLLQGADERIAFPGVSVAPICDILFPGTEMAAGRDRARWVHFMRSMFGPSYFNVRDVYRRALADVIASCKVVAAPSVPVTPRYWSNRVYVVTGFKGCLVHPYTEGLHRQYPVGIAFYRTDEELVRTIQHLTTDEEARTTVAEVGHRETLRSHTYRHRVQKLLEIVNG